MRSISGRAGSAGVTLALARIFNQALAATATFIAARMLGPSNFGIIASGMAVSAVALAGGALGVDQLALQGRISLSDLRRAASGVGIVSAGACLALAALWPGLTWAGRECTLLIGLGYSFDWSRIAWYVEPQLDLDFTARARREFAARVSMPVLLILAVVVWPVSWKPASLAFLVGLAAGSLLARHSLLPPTRSSAGVLGRAAPFAVSSALYTAYFVIDQALLTAFVDARQVGLYRLAASVFNGVVLLPAVFNNEVMRSRLMRTLRTTTDIKTLKAISSSGLWRTTFAVVACVVGMCTFAALVPGVLGDRYLKVGHYIILLSLAVAPNFLSSWASNQVIGLGRVIWVVRTQACLLVLNVAANLVVLPRYGVKGACLTTIATECLGLIAYLPQRSRALRAPVLPVVAS